MRPGIIPLAAANAPALTKLRTWVIGERIVLAIFKTYSQSILIKLSLSDLRIYKSSLEPNFFPIVE